MEKIRRLIIICCLFLLLFPLAGCKPLSWYKIEAKVWNSAKKLFNRTLKKYGNASMLLPDGNYALVWYYSNQKIHITNIIWKRKLIVREYDCDSTLNIKEFNPECLPERKDFEPDYHLYPSYNVYFVSSFMDAETDSLYKVDEFFDVEYLLRKGSDCPVFNQLREHIIKYQLWTYQEPDSISQDSHKQPETIEDADDNLL